MASVTDCVPEMPHKASHPTCSLQCGPATLPQEVESMSPPLVWAVSAPINNVVPFLRTALSHLGPSASCASESRHMYTPAYPASPTARSLSHMEAWEDGRPQEERGQGALSRQARGGLSSHLGSGSSSPSRPHVDQKGTAVLNPQQTPQNQEQNKSLF